MYIKHFGRENVLFLPYEMFKSDPKEFLEKFFSFGGVEPYYPENYNVHQNKSITRNDARKEFSHKNFSSKLLSYFEEDLIDELDNELKSKILSLHSISNRKLSNLLEVDLSQYGYYE